MKVSSLLFVVVVPVHWPQSQLTMFLPRQESLPYIRKVALILLLAIKSALFCCRKEAVLPLWVPIPGRNLTRSCQKYFSLGGGAIAGSVCPASGPGLKLLDSHFYNIQHRYANTRGQTKDKNYGYAVSLTVARRNNQWKAMGILRVWFFGTLCTVHNAQTHTVLSPGDRSLYIRASYRARVGPQFRHSEAFWYRPPANSPRTRLIINTILADNRHNETFYEDNRHTETL